MTTYMIPVTSVNQEYLHSVIQFAFAYKYIFSDLSIHAEVVAAATLLDLYFSALSTHYLIIGREGSIKSYNL